MGKIKVRGPIGYGTGEYTFPPWSEIEVTEEEAVRLKKYGFEPVGKTQQVHAQSNEESPHEASTVTKKPSKRG